MSSGSESHLAANQAALENLSAMADGEVDAAAAARACAAWRDDPSVRMAWHSYQLIGDVLRSEDLAVGHDASFLTALRARLADEPTVLAPDVAAQAPVEAGQHHADAGRSARWSWMAPSAVAAGFVLVAGALMVTRQPTPGTEAGPVSALATFDRGSAREAVLDSSLQAQAPVVVDRKVLRDARLDRYLAAHHQFAGSTALGVPSGFLRNAAAEAPNR
jgi:sigma-E factor negative regulatory protein RseA